MRFFIWIIIHPYPHFISLEAINQKFEKRAKISIWFLAFFFEGAMDFKEDVQEVSADLIDV